MTATTHAPQMNRPQFKTKLAERTLKNPEFRTAFMANPKETLEKEFGTKMADTVKVFAHEEDAHRLHVAIPAVPAHVEDLTKNKPLQSGPRPD